MTVLDRGKSGATLLRRHRNGRPGRVPDPQPSTGPTPVPPAGVESSDRALPDPHAINVRRRRRAEVAPQDQAMYTCQCGYVFAAEVSTSVGCPHCGGAQAW